MDRLGLGLVLSYLLWLVVLTRPLLGYFRPVFSVTQQQTGQTFSPYYYDYYYFLSQFLCFILQDRANKSQMGLAR